VQPWSRTGKRMGKWGGRGPGGWLGVHAVYLSFIAARRERKKEGRERRGGGGMTVCLP
jgi:hypothetical protein